jgi:hypothetical protein
MGDKVTDYWRRCLCNRPFYQGSGEPRYNLSARVALCSTLRPPMSDTLLTDLHVRYIQNLGKVSGSVFKADNILSAQRAGAGVGVARRIRMT